MIKVEELFIEPTATVLETLRKLDETGQRILFIAPEGKLKAVITDGDIRKFFCGAARPTRPLTMRRTTTRSASRWRSAARRAVSCRNTALTRCRC